MPAPAARAASATPRVMPPQPQKRSTSLSLGSGSSYAGRRRSWRYRLSARHFRQTQAIGSSDLRPTALLFHRRSSPIVIPGEGVPRSRGRSEPLGCNGAVRTALTLPGQACRHAVLRRSADGSSCLPRDLLVVGIAGELAAGANGGSRSACPVAGSRRSGLRRSGGGRGRRPLRPGRLSRD